jgi:hypothetical protein
MRFGVQLRLTLRDTQTHQVLCSMRLFGEKVLPRLAT